MVYTVSGIKACQLGDGLCHQAHLLGGNLKTTIDSLRLRHLIALSLETKIGGLSSHLAVLYPEIKPFERLIFPTKYGTPKSLKG